MLQLLVFSLNQSIALCPSWNQEFVALAHLILMKSTGIFSLMVKSESTSDSHGKDPQCSGNPDPISSISEAGFLFKWEKT